MPPSTTTPLFLPEQFVPTKFHSAKDKADFANLLADFILSGFPESKFTKRLYDWLYQNFGMIAHYNQHQFFQEYFTSAEDKVRFIRELMQHPCYGDPEYTFSDMERAFIRWIRANDSAITRAIEGSTSPAEEVAWISIAAVRRRLPVDTEYVGEWIGPINTRDISNGRLGQEKPAAEKTTRRRVIKQSTVEMISAILDDLDDPNRENRTPHLYWANVAAYEDGDAIVLHMKETAKDFLRITFPKEPAVESISGD